MQKISAGNLAGLLECVGVQIFVHLIFYYRDIKGSDFLGGDIYEGKVHYNCWI